MQFSQIDSEFIPMPSGFSRQNSSKISINNLFQEFLEQMASSTNK